MSKDTSTNGAQHAPEAVKRMLVRMCAMDAAECARMVLDRERILTNALRRIATRTLTDDKTVPELRAQNEQVYVWAERALLDLAAYDAPKVPTLLEAVSDYVRAVCRDDGSHAEAFAAVKAAIAREEGGAK